jgi:hypothetical protein
MRFVSRVHPLVWLLIQDLHMSEQNTSSYVKLDQSHATVRIVLLIIYELSQYMLILHKSINIVSSIVIAVMHY